MKDGEQQYYAPLPKNDISLRDYFAGQAMPSVLHKSLRDQQAEWNIAPDRQIDGIARIAYAVADVMLVEREKTT
jgi:hypothetical protein